MTDGHCSAEYTKRPLSFKPSVANIIALCRGANFWDVPAAELDMFSRWIKLSDRALAANHNGREQSGPRGRRKYAAKPA